MAALMSGHDPARPFLRCKGLNRTAVPPTTSPPSAKVAHLAGLNDAPEIDLQACYPSDQVLLIECGFDFMSKPKRVLPQSSVR
jgi:hypothetical protein